MAAKTWTGLGGDENWSTGLNWNLGTVPVTTDTCTFDGAISTKNCTIDAVGTWSGGNITVLTNYGGVITQNVAVVMVGTSTVVNSGSTWIMNANLTTTTLAIADAAVVGGVFTRNSGILAADVNLEDLATLNLGANATITALSTVATGTPTITGTGVITFGAGALALTNNAVWDTSGVTGLNLFGGSVAHSISIGNTSAILSGVPISITGSGNFTMTGANYDFNVVSTVMTLSGLFVIAASADVDFGANPTIRCNGLTVNGEMIASGTVIYDQNSSGTPNIFTVASGGIVSGAITDIVLRGGLTVNAAATWANGIILHINPDVNTVCTITATGRTFGTCVMDGGGSAVGVTIAAGTTITMAADQFAQFTGLFTVTGTLTLLGKMTVFGGLTTSASSNLNGTGVIVCTDSAFTMNATCTVANTVGVEMAFTSGTGRTFAGGGKTYASLRRSGAGSGLLTITGTNTLLGGIYDNDGLVAHTITFPNVTTTVGGFFVRGSTGKLVTLTRTGGAGTFTLATTGGVDINQVGFISVSNSVVDAAPVWYAGLTPPSVNGGGNTNWIFTPAPAEPRLRRSAQVVM